MSRFTPNVTRPTLSLDLTTSRLGQAREIERGMNSCEEGCHATSTDGLEVPHTVISSTPQCSHSISPLDPSPLVVEGLFTLPSLQAPAVANSALFPLEPEWEALVASRRESSSSNFADESNCSSYSESDRAPSPFSTTRTLRTRKSFLDSEFMTTMQTCNLKSRASFLQAEFEEKKVKTKSEESPSTVHSSTTCSSYPSPSKGATVTLPPSPHKRDVIPPPVVMRSGLPNIRPLSVPRMSSPPPPSPTDPSRREMLATVNILLADVVLPYKLRRQYMDRADVQA
ncbi:hypothetical protein NEOLEDRAFT_1246370 [Neolentinus lepideus HHB14362 ss-1]|uniref:Uncharacterized protein n=1 Tax=Neolentinus lepideus HHB14362 ss-1 TaxID=1314782 RepID=A0A165MNW8_9AGAM|nr:hypothetical protein NEOLEDRAFT_1246370 [Neolentinus lepideus HHB14362 ss-1]